MRARTWIVLAAGSSLALASAVRAQQPSPATTAPLDLTVGGPLRVEAGRTLALHLPVKDVSSFWRHVGAVARLLAPAAAAGPTPSTTAPVDAVLTWVDGGAPIQVPLHGAIAELRVAPGAPRTGHYSITWTDPSGRLALQLPAGAAYPVEIVAPGATSVLSGTGSQDLVIFGESVPIAVELQDRRGVGTVTASHRSTAAGPFTTAAMTMVSGDEQRGSWKVEVPRPESIEAVMEYFIEIRNKAGDATSFGTARFPFRIKLPDPTSKP